MSRALVVARLARWLGPWAPATASPRDVDSWDVDADGVVVRWYRGPRSRETGTIFIAPGVHYAGPDDPRLDRLARVFASSGRAVAVPFLPDFIDLRVTPAVFAQVERAFQCALSEATRPPGKPVVFSISFGSLPAFHLASVSHRHEVGSLVAFGGYADWGAAVRFALTGFDPLDGSTRASDPLNKPVVAINLVDAIPDMSPHADLLRPAWKEFCVRTWGRPEMRAPEAYGAVASAIAATLPPGLDELLLVGCGVRPGLVERCEGALRSDRWQHVDPRARLPGIECPVRVFHGLDDDVIAHTQVDAILASLPVGHPARGYRTGLYGHTGAAAVSPIALARELVTMARMLDALAGG